MNADLIALGFIAVLALCGLLLILDGASDWRIK